EPGEQRIHRAPLHRARDRQLGPGPDLARLGHERSERLGELAEQASDLSALEAEVEIAQQPVVRAPGAPGYVFAIGTRELHIALQGRRERGEVVAGPRALPGLLAVRVCARPLGGKLLGPAARALEVA